MTAPNDLGSIPNVRRIENFSKDEMTAFAMDLTHAVYDHDDVYGKYCTLEEYVDCPPEEVFRYLADVRTLAEWTYSLRDFAPSENGQVVATDKIGGKTKIFTKVVSHPGAMTVDFHCAWDQGETLWMIYLMRVIPAQLVFNRPGSVVLWTNCKHPFYEKNPYPAKGPEDRKVWVGDMWPFFYAGHWVEMQNLKAICEHRFKNGLPMIPEVLPVISLIATASYAPPTIIEPSFFGVDESKRTGMFKGPKQRRHVAPGETAVSMIANASEKLASRLGSGSIKEVDLILTNVSLPDSPFTGCGASVARVLGCKPKWVLDLHNTGCVSFVYMLGVARELVASGAVKSALLCCAQTAAGRVFAHPENRGTAQSAVPGDGCGVGYVVANDEAPVRGIVQRSYGDYADDMRVTCDEELPYWEPHRSALRLDFSEQRVAEIVSRGNQLVPTMVRESCRAAEVDVKGIDALVTNQPNAVFLRNWREALQIPKEKQIETYDEFGNLFGAAIPMNIERAVGDGRIAKGMRVALGGFSHAGDYAAAAIWQPG